LLSQSRQLLWVPLALRQALCFQRKGKLQSLPLEFDFLDLAKCVGELTIPDIRTLAKLWLAYVGRQYLQNVAPPSRRLSRGRLARACEGKRPALQEAFGLQQHASDVVVLGGIANEKIEFGHEALEHFCGRDGLSRFNRAQQAPLPVFILAGVFGLH